MTENPVLTIRPGLVRPRLLSIRKAEPPLNIKIADNAEKKPMLRIKITDQVITKRSSEALDRKFLSEPDKKLPVFLKKSEPDKNVTGSEPNNKLSKVFLSGSEPDKKLPDSDKKLPKVFLSGSNPDPDKKLPQVLKRSEPDKKLPVLKNVKPKKSVKTEIIYDLLEHKPSKDDDDEDEEALGLTNVPESDNLGQSEQERSANKPLTNPYLISTAPMLGCSSFRIMSETKVRKEVHAPPDTQPVTLDPIVIANNIYLICHENHCIYNPDNEEKIGIINNDRSIFWYD
jgi:hypothetical protein